MQHVSLFIDTAFLVGKLIKGLISRHFMLQFQRELILEKVIFSPLPHLSTMLLQFLFFQFLSLARPYLYFTQNFRHWQRRGHFGCILVLRGQERRQSIVCDTPYFNIPRAVVEEILLVFEITRKYTSGECTIIGTPLPNPSVAYRRDVIIFPEEPDQQMIRLRQDCI